MIHQQLTTTQWLALTPNVRARLKEVFGIPRSEGTQMVDNRVLSDGHNHRDLSVITIERMQSFTGAEDTDFYKLFEKTLEVIEGEAKTDAPIAPAAPVIVSKPAEELFITHNGKTYKLTEVSDPSGMANSAILHNTTPAVVQPSTPPVKNKGGRPKGSKNKPK